MAEILVRIDGERRALTLAQAAEMIEAQQWQPIETAPKDGETVLLVTVDHDGERHILSAYYEAAADFGGVPDDGPGWFLTPTNGNHLVTGRPSHWMPFPSPPQTMEAISHDGA